MHPIQKTARTFEIVSEERHRFTIHEVSNPDKPNSSNNSFCEGVLRYFTSVGYQVEQLSDHSYLIQGVGTCSELDTNIHEE